MSIDRKGFLASIPLFAALTPKFVKEEEPPVTMIQPAEDAPFKRMVYQSSEMTQWISVSRTTRVP